MQAQEIDSVDGVDTCTRAPRKQSRLDGRKLEFAAAILLLGAATIFTARIWTSNHEAWLHPELLGTSAYIWNFPESETFLDRSRKFLDWKAFDPNVNRVRPLNDVAETFDAIARPSQSDAFGPHPSITPVALFTAVLSPLFLFLYLYNTLGKRPLAAAVLTALFISSIGFLSVHVAYIRPAKKLTILFLCLCLYLADRYGNRRTWPRLIALASVVFASCFADEMGLAHFVVVAMLFPTAIFRDASWRRRLVYLAIPVLFLVTVKWILPAIYVQWSVHGEWNALADSKKGAILQYLLEPGFYHAWGVHCVRAVLTTVGISQHNVWTEGGVLLLLVGLPIVAYAHRGFRRANPASCYFLAASTAALFATSLYATLLDWYPFPFEVSYLGSFTYYYHSPLAVMVVVWLAAVWRAAALATASLTFARLPRAIPIGAAAAICGVVLTANFWMFGHVNRLVQIIHTYPYAADSIQAAIAERQQARQLDGAPLSIGFREEPQRLDDEFYGSLQAIYGENWEQTRFHELYQMFHKTPIMQARHLGDTLHAHYPQREFDVHIESTAVWR